MYNIHLRGDSETEPNKGVVTVQVPTKPNDKLEVYVNRPDGTLDRVYRFNRECLISIEEL